MKEHSNILEVHGLIKTHLSSKGRVLRALNNVTFSLPEESILAIIGETGAGKSTVASIITRSTSNYGGVLFFNDKIVPTKFSASELASYTRHIQGVTSSTHKALDKNSPIISLLEKHLTEQQIIKNETIRFLTDYNIISETFKFPLEREHLRAQLRVYTVMSEGTLKGARSAAAFLGNFEHEYGTRSAKEQATICINGYFEQLHQAQREINHNIAQTFIDAFNYFDGLKKTTNQKAVASAHEIALLEARRALDDYEKNYKGKQRIKLFVGKAKRDGARRLNGQIKQTKSALFAFSNDYQVKMRLITAESRQNPSPEATNRVRQQIALLKARLSVINVIMRRDFILKTETLKRLYQNLSLVSMKDIHEFQNKTEKAFAVETKKAIEKISMDTKNQTIAIKNRITQKELTGKQYALIENRYRKAMRDFQMRRRDDVNKFNVERRLIEKEIAIVRNKINAQEVVAYERGAQRHFVDTMRTLMGRIKSKDLQHALKQLWNKHEKSIQFAIKCRTHLLDIFKNIAPIYNISGAKRIYRHVHKSLATKIILENFLNIGLSAESLWENGNELTAVNRQRLSIVWALIIDPEVLLVDEDERVPADIQKKILHVLETKVRREGLSLIFLTANPLLIRHVADVVVVMHRGRIVESGRREDVFTNPVHPYTRAFLTTRMQPEEANLTISTTDLTYLEEYREHAPSMMNVDAEHFVLANEIQLKIWMNEKNL